MRCRVSFVFSAHRLHNRELEFASFILIGLVGWAINLLVLFIAHGKLGIDLVLGEGAGGQLHFLANFALRRQLLFRARALGT